MENNGNQDFEWFAILFRESVFGSITSFVFYNDLLRMTLEAKFKRKKETRKEKRFLEGLSVTQISTRPQQ